MHENNNNNNSSNILFRGSLLRCTSWLHSRRKSFDCFSNSYTTVLLQVHRTVEPWKRKAWWWLDFLISGSVVDARFTFSCTFNKADDAPFSMSILSLEKTTAAFFDTFKWDIFHLCCCYIGHYFDDDAIIWLAQENGDFHWIHIDDSKLLHTIHHCNWPIHQIFVRLYS